MVKSVTITSEDHFMMMLIGSQEGPWSRLLDMLFEVDGGEGDAEYGDDTDNNIICAVANLVRARGGVVREDD